MIPPPPLHHLEAALRSLPVLFDSAAFSCCIDDMTGEGPCGLHDPDIDVTASEDYRAIEWALTEALSHG